MNIDHILNDVIDAMNAAEEMGGPLCDDYMKLMTEIAAEAITRMKNYRSGSYGDDLQEELKKLTKPVMSFDEFRKTGKNYKDTELRPDRAQFGRIYDGNCHIGLLDNGNWWLQICNEEYEDPDLTKLEQILYRDWYVSNQ